MIPNAPSEPRPKKKIGKGPVVIALAVFAIVAVLGIVMRMHEASSLARGDGR